MSHFDRRAAIVSLGILISLGSAACGKGAETADSAAAAPAMAPSVQAPADAALNDAQIAHIVVTANSIDSAAGVAAKAKGMSKTVKDFAQTMITDHSGVNVKATALATKLGVTPEDNTTSQQLQAGAAESAAALQGMSGANFDRAYIDREVGYHEAVLDALDKTLVPSAQNAELKALMVKVRPAFVAHLEHARRLQTSLGAK